MRRIPSDSTEDPSCWIWTSPEYFSVQAQICPTYPVDADELMELLSVGMNWTPARYMSLLPAILIASFAVSIHPPGYGKTTVQFGSRVTISVIFCGFPPPVTIGALLKSRAAVASTPEGLRNFE